MVDVSRDGRSVQHLLIVKTCLQVEPTLTTTVFPGAIDFLDVGEPGTGIYEVYEYNAGGVQEVIDELTFQAGAAPTQAAPAPAPAGIGLNALDTPTKNEYHLCSFNCFPTTVDSS
ncbi:MAG: hypothetical protein Ct9H90mP5_04380 [Acidimicrobiaceae bacterium]|nr:MAG: hypothetical protein Ct9H90mP5_04380 [Acidimicrobiaceae bacterium]